jgi:hypothetical protein
MRAQWPCLLVAALAITPAAARAAPPQAAPATERSDEDVARAVSRFKRGQELYNERNYRVLYNIGQVCYQMQDYVCGLHALEQYLADGGDDIATSRREAVNVEISGLKQRIGYLDIRIDLAGAEISIDDAVVGTSPLAAPVAVSAGRHRAVITLPDHVPVARSIDVAGQDTARVDIVLAAATAVAAPAAAERSATPPEVSRRPSMTTLSWIGYGIGGAMIAGAAITGTLALGAANDVKTTVYPDEAAARSDRSRATTFAITSDALIVGSVLALATTTLLTFVLPRRGPTGNAGLTLTPGGFAGRFTF